MHAPTLGCTVRAANQTESTWPPSLSSLGAWLFFTCFRLPVSGEALVRGQHEVGLAPPGGGPAGAYVDTRSMDHQRRSIRSRLLICTYCTMHPHWTRTMHPHWTGGGRGVRPLFCLAVVDEDLEGRAVPPGLAFPLVPGGSRSITHGWPSNRFRVRVCTYVRCVTPPCEPSARLHELADGIKETTHAGF